MFFFRLLPWEYAIRNLFRRPLRTALTFAGLTTVILLVFVVVGFIRGLGTSLIVSGDPQTAIVFSLGMGENLEYSSISMGTDDVVAASVEGIEERYGQKYVSPELYLGTEVTVAGSDDPEMGLVRGVTPSVLLVRRQVELEQGHWPEDGRSACGPTCGDQARRRTTMTWQLARRFDSRAESGGSVASSLPAVPRLSQKCGADLTNCSKR